MKSEEILDKIKEIKQKITLLYSKKNELLDNEKEINRTITDKKSEVRVYEEEIGIISKKKILEKVKSRYASLKWKIEIEKREFKNIRYCKIFSILGIAFLAMFFSVQFLDQNIILRIIALLMLCPIVLQAMTYEHASKEFNDLLSSYYAEQKSIPQKIDSLTLEIEQLYSDSHLMDLNAEIQDLEQSLKQNKNLVKDINKEIRECEGILFEYENFLAQSIEENVIDISSLDRDEVNVLAVIAVDYLKNNYKGSFCKTRDY